MVKKFIFTSKHAPTEIVVYAKNGFNAKQKVIKLLTPYLNRKNVDVDNFVNTTVGSSYSVRIIETDFNEIVFGCANGNIW